MNGYTIVCLTERKENTMQRKESAIKGHKWFVISSLVLILAFVIMAVGSPVLAQQGVIGTAEKGVNKPIKTPPLKVADHATMKGKSYQMAILGIGGWPPSKLSVDLAQKYFTKYAKDTYGYDVRFTFQESPFSALFQKAAASLATKANEYNLIISDSQWLGALAEPGWIVCADDIIKLEPSLDIEWASPVLQTSYQVYPDGTDQRWGFPQEADVVVLFVRKDMMSNPTERANFKAKYGRDLPQTYEDWVKEDFDSFQQIAGFFTRPDKQMYGTVMQYSKEYDFMSMFLYPFWFSFGNDIWNPNTRNVYGILNKPQSAKANEYNKLYLKYQPQGAINYGISENADAFTQGKAMTAFQWAAMGPTMIPDNLKDKVMVVPPPGFKKPDGSIYRLYCVGGQPWVVSAFNTPEQQRIAIDYLKWWYLPDTQLLYAKNGGNPSDKATLSRENIDSIQPWFRAMKDMFSQSRDFWHDPTYSALLATQQEGWTAFASGAATDAVKVNEWIACQQQKILYDAGRTITAPPSSCTSAAYK
jgi:multiple sugar transport system substrate-binding protein